MTTRITKWISGKTFFAALAFFGLSIGAVNAQSGTCGASLNWSYNATTKVLDITGTGAMTNFSPYGPWYGLDIEQVIIGSGATTIGELAFNNCTSITSVTLPSTLITIGMAAFQNCTALTSVVIPDNVKIINDFTFFGCNSLSSVNIPNGVTSIGLKAFLNCRVLTSIVIPSSITSIGDQAFYGCNGFISITCLNPNPATITLGVTVFTGMNKTTCVLKVPTGSYSAYHTAPQWSDFTNIVEGATGIGSVYLQNLKIYPNPVKDELIIENADLRISNVEICDLSGKTVYQFDNLKNKINVSALSQGIYIVKLKTDKGIVTEKFIKE